MKKLLMLLLYITLCIANVHAEINACGTPNVALFGTTQKTATSARPDWVAVSGAQSYNVQYRIRNVGSAYSAPVSTSTNYIVLTGLIPSTNYEFIVQTVCSGEVGVYSSSGWFTTTVGTSTTCSVPDVNMFGTTQKTSNSARVDWKTISGAQSYNVQYRIRNVGASYSASTNTTNNYLTITGLQASTNYEFIVQTVCSSGSSSFSASGWFTTTSGGGSTATLTRGPYITITTTNNTTIQWRTATATNSEVRIGTDANNLSYIVSDPGLVTNHSVHVSGLVANTKYFYSIGEIGTKLQGDVNNYFITAPINNSTVPLKFWVTGDFGNGSSAQTSVRNSFTSYMNSQPINGWLWLGDNAYNTGTDAEYQSKVFNVYPNIFKNASVFPAPGNHDYASSGYLSSAARGTNFPYFSIFDITSNSGTEKYYSTNYGNVHFIALDSYGAYNTVGSPMYNWLQADLINNTQQWTVVYFHHAPYSKGSHDSNTSSEMVDMRANIIPLLESHGVDLVLAGHSHIYERSFFMKGHYGSETSFSSSMKVQSGDGLSTPYTKSSRKGDGTVYVVCGVSGQSGGATQSGYPHNAMNTTINNRNGSLILSINGNTLNCKFLTSSGTIDDEFNITKPLQLNIPSSPETVNPNKNIRIYPNPTSSSFIVEIQSDQPDNINLSMYDSVGKLVYETNYEIVPGTNKIEISKDQLQNKSSGSYILKIKGLSVQSGHSLIIN